MCRAAERLHNEICLQQNLSHQKNLQYHIRKKETSLNDIRTEVDLMLKGHPAANAKKLEALCSSEDVILYTDPMLASKVLGNMLINALEATPEGGSVHFKTLTDSTHVVWEVWNDGYIPTHIQERLFQKHFSTKARLGRGLGTYSMKLFGERYLAGEVSFASSQEGGTVFTFRLPRR
jgi:signal transduction histidine kinase